MKRIGLIGGMSWESTLPYYRIINEAVKERMGGLHSAELVLYSVDFQAIETLQRAGSWDDAGAALAGAAVALERAGAELLVVCTNTMHIVAPAIEAAVSIPLLHIADPAAEAARHAGVDTVGLLGTRFTMEQDFYVDRLRQRHGLSVIVPDETDREEVHRVIFEELCLGRVLTSSRAAFEAIVARLAARGAGGVILGCTELAMLVEPERLAVPAFDTTRLHALAAVDAAFAPASR
jgi:aspartate racemase